MQSRDDRTVTQTFESLEAEINKGHANASITTCISLLRTLLAHFSAEKTKTTEAEWKKFVGLQRETRLIAEGKERDISPVRTCRPTDPEAREALNRHRKEVDRKAPNTKRITDLRRVVREFPIKTFNGEETSKYYKPRTPSPQASEDWTKFLNF